jgi:hypothetical protein
VESLDIGATPTVLSAVIPTKVGIHGSGCAARVASRRPSSGDRSAPPARALRFEHWIPACAGMTDREGGASHLYFTLTPAPNPFAPNANPRFFGKVIPVPSSGIILHPIRFARTKSTANDA